MTNFYSYLTDRAIIKISGRDKTEFLNSLLTNNIKKLDKLNIIYSLLLNPQGKYTHDMLIFLDEDQNYIIDLHRDGKEEFIKRLNFYKLRSEIYIEEIDKFKIYNVKEIKNIEIDTENISIFSDPRLKELGYRIYSPRKLEFSNLIEEDYNLIRIKYGIAEGHKDLIYNKSFPLYYNLQYLNGIDYQKGCYVGQEVTARTTYRGVIRKFLVIIESNKNIENHSIIYDSMEEIGQISSISGRYGLALVNKIISDGFINEEPVKISLPEWSKNHIN